MAGLFLFLYVSAFVVNSKFIVIIEFKRWLFPFPSYVTSFLVTSKFYCDN